VLVDRRDELVAAIRRVDDLDPAACREHVRRRFSRAAMIDAYESLFHRLAEGGGKESIPLQALRPTSAG
jgi:hypothetical protein